MNVPKLFVHLTQDWFYSLRWVPSRIFSKRIESGSDVLEHKLAYRAHKVH